MSRGFGLFPEKSEGEAMHPDDSFAGGIGCCYGASDEEFLKQLQAYYDAHGDSTFEVWCSRPALLKKITRNG